MKTTPFFFNKVLFLILLASPKRISEFQATSISKSYLQIDKAILRTHDKFIKKNATNSFNPPDISIPSFPEDENICPIANLNKYIEITARICEEKRIPRPDQLFIKEDTTPYTLHQLRSSIKDIIIRSEPASIVKNTSFHSMRKVASTTLDYRGYTLQQIISSMQWRSQNTYTKYYCKLGLVRRSTRGCVVAGRHLPST